MKSKIKLIVKLALCCLGLSCLAFIPRDEDPLGKLVSTLQKWTDTIPQEKIYLHMDKPYYTLGDTVWFKGYLTIGSRHQLSKLSGAVYVDLITEQDSVAQTLKLPVTSGMVMGNFILNDEFKQGSYRIRAYTQWMRNAGPEYFFDHTFTVGDVANDNVISKVKYQYKTVNGKTVLTALLSYTNDLGKPLAMRDLRYQEVVDKHVIWSRSAKTDQQGNLEVTINNDGKSLGGAYIRTTISNGKQAIVRDLPVNAASAQSDVQFFPEGGNLVNGIASRVAFKAIGIDGLGLAIKGAVVDETGKEVTTFETLHAGMGSFSLKPQAGKSYSANLIYADGSKQTLALPKASDEGYVLSVYQPVPDSICVRVHASGSLLQSTANLIVHTGGETVFASPIKISSAITSIWIDKKAFPSGIAQFTLFNAAGEPLNERVAFIRSKDLLSLDVKTAKTTYKSKEFTQINLEAKDSKGKPAPGNFSVSVIDESKLPFDENKESTIFSNILLTSDLKGYVEEPNYYFAHQGDEVDKAMDNLMLTQGYRRFTWKELDKTVSTKPQFAPEDLGFEINGTVTTLGKKILPNAQVMLLSLRARVTKTTTTDAKGRFKFGGMFLTDSIKFVVQARTDKGSDHTILTLDTLPKMHLAKNKYVADMSTDINTTLKTYLAEAQKQDDIYEKYGLLDKVHRLREVTIRAKKAKPEENIAPQGMFKIPPESADQTYFLSQDEVCSTWVECLQGRLHGVNFGIERGTLKITDVRGEHMMLIIDGRKIDGGEMDGIETSLEPGDIAKVQVVRTDLAMINFLGGKAVLILTKSGYTRKYYNPSTVNISPKGFNKVREFYSPRYKAGRTNEVPDLRTTVYWNPYLKTNEAGQCLFNYFNADGPGAYKVIVEGISASGELGRQVYHYKVDENGIPALAANPSRSNKNAALITAPLDSFNKHLPKEKIYLHTDKSYYNVGDTLWFKSYLLNAASLSPSKLSGILYVELIDDSAVVMRRVSMRIKGGLAWAQIPLTKAIFREGTYTLRAYTNWMQNFGNDIMFTRRFYIGAPREDVWMVNTQANITRVNNADQLNVQLKLNHPDKYLSPVALRKVLVKIYEGRDNLYEFQRYLYKEKLQTGIDGSIKLSQKIKDKMDVRRVRIEITGLEKPDDRKILKLPLFISRIEKIDLQFLPEGGHFVAGLKSTVGVKAIGENGRSTEVTGSIYDSKNDKVVSFASVHNGMGSFEFTPKPNEVYTAKLVTPNVNNYVLPKAELQGTVMHIENTKQGDSLKIALAGLNFLSKDTACYLVGTAKGVAYYSQVVSADRPVISVPKNIFPSGIARFTFFKANKPLNERMVYINTNDRMNIHVTQNKAAYDSRDSVGLEVEVKDKDGIPIQGNFSLAVTDDSQVKDDSLNNNGIAANLLITSELKGDIEAPGYYLNSKDKRAWQALDNLLLTQGWTSYEWADVFAPAKVPAFRLEKDFEISGSVKKLFDKPAVMAPVILSSQKPQFLVTGLTDTAGRFTFTNLPTVDSGSFFVQVNNERGRRMVQADIKLDRFTPAPTPPDYDKPISPWYANTDTTEITYLQRKIQKAHQDDLKLTGRVLKEVVINKTRIIKGSVFNGKSNLAFDEQDIKESHVDNLYDLLTVKIRGFRILEDWKMHHGNIYWKIGDEDYVDGMTIDGHPFLTRAVRANPQSYQEYIDYLKQIKIHRFKSLEVVLSRSYPEITGYNPDHYFAIIAITTSEDHSTDNYTKYKPGATFYQPMPVLYPEQFYSPKYKAPIVAKNIDDRSTIFWQPDITTDENGKAKVSFFTSDIKADYTIKIAGVDFTGGIGEGIFKIKQPPAAGAPGKSSAATK